MELTELKAKLLDSWSGNQEDLQEVIKLVEQDKSVFPFNDFEYLVCNLLDRKGLTFQQYLDIRSEYISANPNLWIFEISAP
jgi:predicted RNA-binding protein associated with RNAse of E/G family